MAEQPSNHESSVVTQSEYPQRCLSNKKLAFWVANAVLLLTACMPKQPTIAIAPEYARAAGSVEELKATIDAEAYQRNLTDMVKATQTAIAPTPTTIPTAEGPFVREVSCGTVGPGEGAIEASARISAIDGKQFDVNTSAVDWENNPLIRPQPVGKLIVDGPILREQQILCVGKITDSDAINDTLEEEIARVRR